MSNTITNIGRVSGRRNPTPAGNSSVVLATVEANGFSLVLLPNEDPGALFDNGFCLSEEKDAKPGLGLEPDAAWTPVSEVDLMEIDLVALRCGPVRPYAAISKALEAIEDEAIGLEFSIQPYNW